MKQWDDVRNAFKDNDRILVTTATQSVANRCSNHPHQNKETFGYVYNMRPLGKDDSMKIALLGRCTPELKQGAEKLLTKCGGLPLALHSVACRLSDESVPTGEFCSKLCQDLGAYLDSQDVDEPNFARLRGVLRENYTGLSNHTVRTCLLYLGIFPMDRPLKRSVIMQTRTSPAEPMASCTCSCCTSPCPRNSSCPLRLVLSTRKPVTSSSMPAATAQTPE